MPLLSHTTLSPAGELGIWQTTEPEAYFRERLPLTPEEAAYIDGIPGAGRRREWLASRYLLHKMSGRAVRGVVFKDRFGKPHLENSAWQISISHTRDRVAVMAHPRRCGVDIQVLVPKIERLAPKFMRPEELASLTPTTRLEHLHVYWGAKEALYKAYGRRQLDFRSHIHIRPFRYGESSLFFGCIEKEDFKQHFRLHHQQDNQIILVTGIAL